MSSQAFLILLFSFREGIDYKKTVSCYQADARGYACNHCDSCKLRKEGFVQAGIEDQTHYF